MPEEHQVLSPFLGEIILGLAAQGEGSPQVCSAPSQSSDGKGRGGGCHHLSPCPHRASKRREVMSPEASRVLPARTGATE